MLRPEAGDDNSDQRLEVRAVKDISMGEEITIFYPLSKHEGCSLLFKENRRIALSRKGIADCKCRACTDDDTNRDEILKDLSIVHPKVYTTYPKEGAWCDWSKHAKLCEQYAELIFKTDLGRITDKIKMLELLVESAHVAMDQVLVQKALEMWLAVIEDTKLEELKKPYEEAKKEIDSFGA